MEPKIMLRVAPCNEVTIGRKCFRIVSYFTSQHPWQYKGGIFLPVQKEDKKILVFGGETQNFISVNISSRSIMSLKSGNSSCHHRR